MIHSDDVRSSCERVHDGCAMHDCYAIDDHCGLRAVGNNTIAYSNQNPESTPRSDIHAVYFVHNIYE